MDTTGRERFSCFPYLRIVWFGIVTKSSPLMMTLRRNEIAGCKTRTHSGLDYPRRLRDHHWVCWSKVARIEFPRLGGTIHFRANCLCERSHFGDFVYPLKVVAGLLGHIRDCRSAGCFPANGHFARGGMVGMVANVSRPNGDSRCSCLLSMESTLGQEIFLSVRATDFQVGGVAVRFFLPELGLLLSMHTSATNPCKTKLKPICVFSRCSHRNW